jgi:hypothetical protein
MQHNFWHKVMTVLRLLARVLKEGVQFWYNEIFIVKRGGGGAVRENVPLENL